uniref:Uncharacterized protein n=1 Tax=Rhizophagus irregularis (strain DAOM 181602 / DAOM 197198 / MUCL 43194) TaxID=747089 RepID=U9T2Y4_RHIID
MVDTLLKYNSGGSLGQRLKIKAGNKSKIFIKMRYFQVCSVHSLKNMLLWKIAFDVIPYRNWNYTNIIDRIKAAWQNDPILRPRLHELFNHYTL